MKGKLGTGIVFWWLWVAAWFMVANAVQSVTHGRIPVLSVLLLLVFVWALHPRGLNYWGRYFDK